MGVKIENPLASYNNALVRKSKYLMVRTFAMQQTKNVTKAEEKVKAITKAFRSEIYNGSTGGLNVRI